MNGIGHFNLCPPCATQYSDDVSSPRRFVPNFPDDGLSSTAGSIQRPECLTHMKSRISKLNVSSESPSVDLTVYEMPPLDGMGNQAPGRKDSSDSNDTFDFAEIDKRMGRVGGRRFAPDPTVWATIESGL